MSRKRGRPALPDDAKAQSAILHIRLPPALHDHLCRVALRIDRPVSVVARRILEQEAKRLAG